MHFFRAWVRPYTRRVSQARQECPGRRCKEPETREVTRSLDLRNLYQWTSLRVHLALRHSCAATSSLRHGAVAAFCAKLIGKAVHFLGARCHTAKS